jgi:hypothetical protein
MRALFLVILVVGAFAAGAAIANAPQSRALFARSTPAARFNPSFTIAQAPAASPQAAAASPQAQPTPEYRFVYTATPSPQSTPFPGPHAPQINEIDLNDQTLVTPGHLRVRVLTNYEVSSVVAKTMGYELAIPKMKSGVFAAEYDVPQVPAMLSNQTFQVDFVATVPDGRISTVTLPLSLK